MSLQTRALIIKCMTKQLKRAFLKFTTDMWIFRIPAILFSELMSLRSMIFIELLDILYMTCSEHIYQKKTFSPRQIKFNRHEN